MRWKTGRRSSNVEDRRGLRRVGGKVKGGGIGIVLLVLVGMYFGIDPSVILNSNLVGGGDSVQQSSSPRSPEEDRLADFVSVVLADTEDTWATIFQEAGGRYQKPKLVLKSRGYVVPDSFTHGSSKQRVKWFRQGLENGDIRGCNTFG